MPVPRWQSIIHVLTQVMEFCKFSFLIRGPQMVLMSKLDLLKKLSMTNMCADFFRQLICPATVVNDQPSSTIYDQSFLISMSLCKLQQPFDIPQPLLLGLSFVSFAKSTLQTKHQFPQVGTEVLRATIKKKKKMPHSVYHKVICFKLAFFFIE